VVKDRSRVNIKIAVVRRKSSLITDLDIFLIAPRTLKIIEGNQPLKTEISNILTVRVLWDVTPYSVGGIPD
jgi:hypothetical protein